MILTDVSVYNYINHDTLSERQAQRRESWVFWFFQGKAIGEYRVLPVISATSQLSKHLRTRKDTQRGESVSAEHMPLPN